MENKLNSTSIGKIFGKTAKQINNILLEHELIWKKPITGKPGKYKYEITLSGTRFGTMQEVKSTSGLYIIDSKFNKVSQIMWNKEIIDYLSIHYPIVK